MRLSRSHTRVAALIALLGIVFTQLALALYVCPDFSAEGSHPASHAAAPMQMTGDAPSMAMGTDCAAIDKDNPNLCLQYSQAGSQSLDRGVVYVPLMLVVLYFAFIFSRPVVGSDAYFRYVPDLLKRDTAPPLSIQHCCFRI